jgi:hypothetical protein
MPRWLLALAALAATASLAVCASGGASHSLPASQGEETAVKLYRGKCAGCHRLHAPAEYARDAWVPVLDRMSPRAHLSDEEHGELLRYLQAHAKDAG